LKSNCREKKSKSKKKYKNCKNNLKVRFVLKTNIWKRKRYFVEIPYNSSYEGTLFKSRAIQLNHKSQALCQEEIRDTRTLIKKKRYKNS